MDLRGDGLRCIVPAATTKRLRSQEERTIDIPNTAPIFAWKYLDDSPTLQDIDRLLRAVPDRPLIDALKAHRGKGRNDYPVETCWGVLLLTGILRHPTIEATLAELRRNGALRTRLGILGEEEVPKACTMSRFTKTLGRPEFLELLQATFAQMVGELADEVPNLGRHTAGDSTALKARRDRATAHPDLPQPSGGRKEYRDDDGEVTKVIEWFGYKLHLLVDTDHEVALAYRVTGANTDDARTLPAVLDSALEALPEGRLETLAYDKAADGLPFHQELAERHIRPVVEIRSQWHGEPYRELPGNPERPVPIVHDEAGTLFCCSLEAGAEVYKPMYFCGYEKNRGTLKYTCPAIAHGFSCPHEKVCNAGKLHGLSVRAKCEIDLRRFPPIPRATQKFERLYRGRTAVERVNARLKVFWGADDGNIGGAARFHAQVAVTLLVHQAFARVLAETPRKDGVLGITRLGPLQKALRQAAMA